MGRATQQTATVYIDRGDDELEVEVFCQVYSGEKEYFDVRSGEGHPGCGPEVEFLRAECDGKTIELSENEKELAIEALYESLEEDSDDSDDGPDSY